MEDTVLSSEEDLLDIPIGIPNRSRRGSHASGLTLLGGHGSYILAFLGKNHYQAEIPRQILFQALQVKKFPHFDDQIGFPQMR